MKTRNGPFNVLVTLVTLWSFLFNSVSYDFAWAARTPLELTGVSSNRADSPGAVIKELNVETFTLPEYLGHTKDSFRGNGSDKVIIHIQDAHCNYAAQHKIAEIIEYLNKEYGVDTVNLEGGAKDYDLSVFTNIYDKSIRDKVADYFIKQGLVNGAEYFAINNPKKTTLWGIEDVRLYHDNLNVYRESLKHKEEVDKNLKALSYIINNLKTKIYSKDLLDLDAEYSQYKANNMDFKVYLIYLVSVAKDKRIDAKALHNIFLLQQTLELEGAIDFRSANNQRDSIIDSLQKVMSRNELEELVAKTVDFKAERLSQNEFYEYLFKKAKSINIELSNFPDFQKYFVYASTYNAIDKSKIMEEISALEDNIKEALYQNDEQRELNKLSKTVVLLNNIFNISLTKDDYQYYMDNKESFDVANFTSFINKKAPLYKITAQVSQNIADLDQYRESILRFYEYSFKRDDVFLKNMRFSGRKNIAVVVTGGFHTENLCDLFRKEKISFISIMPAFKNCDGYESSYFKLLSGKESELVTKLYSVVTQASSMQISSMLSTALGEEVWGEIGVSAFRAAVLIREEIEKGNNIVGIEKIGKDVRFRIQLKSGEIQELLVPQEEFLKWLQAEVNIDALLKEAYDAGRFEAIDVRFPGLRKEAADRLRSLAGKVHSLGELDNAKRLEKIASEIEKTETPVNLVDAEGANFEAHAGGRGIHINRGKIDGMSDDEMKKAKIVELIVHEAIAAVGGAHVVADLAGKNNLTEAAALLNDSGMALQDAAMWEMDQGARIGILNRDHNALGEITLLGIPLKDLFATKDFKALLAAYYLSTGSADRAGSILRISGPINPSFLRNGLGVTDGAKLESLIDSVEDFAVNGRNAETNLREAGKMAEGYGRKDYDRAVISVMRSIDKARSGGRAPSSASIPNVPAATRFESNTTEFQLLLAAWLRAQGSQRTLDIVLSASEWSRSSGTTIDTVMRRIGLEPTGKLRKEFIARINGQAVNGINDKVTAEMLRKSAEAILAERNGQFAAAGKNVMSKLQGGEKALPQSTAPPIGQQADALPNRPGPANRVFNGDRDALQARVDEQEVLRDRIERGDLPDVINFGDKHGENEELQRILDKAEKAAEEGKKLVIVGHGDAFDRGVHNFENFRIFKRLKEIANTNPNIQVNLCFGNHDVLLIQAILLGDEGALMCWLQNGGFAFMNELGIQDIRELINDKRMQDLAKWLLANLKLFHMDERGFLHLHAGVPADVDGNPIMTRQDIENLQHVLEEIQADVARGKIGRERIAEFFADPRGKNDKKAHHLVWAREGDWIDNFIKDQQKPEIVIDERNKAMLFDVMRQQIQERMKGQVSSIDPVAMNQFLQGQWMEILIKNEDRFRAEGIEFQILNNETVIDKEKLDNFLAKLGVNGVVFGHIHLKRFKSWGERIFCVDVDEGDPGHLVFNGAGVRFNGMSRSAEDPILSKSEMLAGMDGEIIRLKERLGQTASQDKELQSAHSSRVDEEKAATKERVLKEQKDALFPKDLMRRFRLALNVVWADGSMSLIARESTKAPGKLRIHDIKVITPIAAIYRRDGQEADSLLIDEGDRFIMGRDASYGAPYTFITKDGAFDIVALDAAEFSKGHIVESGQTGEELIRAVMDNKTVFVLVQRTSPVDMSHFTVTRAFVNNPGNVTVTVNEAARSDTKIEPQAMPMSRDEAWQVLREITNAMEITPADMASFGLVPSQPGVSNTTSKIAIANEDIVKHNTEKLKSVEFREVLLNESVGGNAGPNRAGVNAAIDQNGQIIAIGNIQDLSPDIRNELNKRNGKYTNVCFSVIAFNTQFPRTIDISESDGLKRLTDNARENIEKAVSAYNESIAKTTKSAKKSVSVATDLMPGDVLIWPNGNTGKVASIDRGLNEIKFENDETGSGGWTNLNMLERLIDAGKVQRAPASAAVSAVSLQAKQAKVYARPAALNRDIIDLESEMQRIGAGNLPRIGIHGELAGHKPVGNFWYFVLDPSLEDYWKTEYREDRHLDAIWGLADGSMSLNDVFADSAEFSERLFGTVIKTAKYGGTDVSKENLPEIYLLKNIPGKGFVLHDNAGNDKEPGRAQIYNPEIGNQDLRYFTVEGFKEATDVPAEAVIERIGLTQDEVAAVYGWAATDRSGNMGAEYFICRLLYKKALEKIIEIARTAKPEDGADRMLRKKKQAAQKISSETTSVLWGRGVSPIFDIGTRRNIIEQMKLLANGQGNGNRTVRVDAIIVGPNTLSLGRPVDIDIERISNNGQDQVVASVSPASAYPIEVALDDALRKTGANVEAGDKVRDVRRAIANNLVETTGGQGVIKLAVLPVAMANDTEMSPFGVADGGALFELTETGIKLKEGIPVSAELMFWNVMHELWHAAINNEAEYNELTTEEKEVIATIMAFNGMGNLTDDNLKALMKAFTGKDSLPSTLTDAGFVSGIAKYYVETRPGYKAALEGKEQKMAQLVTQITAKSEEVAGSQTMKAQQVRNDLRGGTTDIITLPGSNLIENKNGQFSIARAINSQSGKKFGSDTVVAHYAYDEKSQDNRLAALRTVINKNTEALLDRIMKGDIHARHMVVVNFNDKEFIEKLIRDIVKGMVGLSDQMRQNLIDRTTVLSLQDIPPHGLLDDANLVVGSKGLLNAKRYEADEYPGETLSPEAASKLKDFLSAIFDLTGIGKDAREIIRRILSGVVVKVRPINLQTIREYQDRANEVMRAL